MAHGVGLARTGIPLRDFGQQRSTDWSRGEKEFIAVLNPIAWSKRTRGGDGNGYSFRLLEPMFWIAGLLHFTCCPAGEELGVQQELGGTQPEQWTQSGQRCMLYYMASL